jgi:hypothetical protein
MKMDYRRQKTVAVVIGGVFLASLLVNLIQILIRNPRNFIDMFKLTKEVGLPWIPYISIAVILLSVLGGIGLMKYRQWGFYGIYLSCLAGAVVAWFPFFPGFLLQFTSGIFKSVLTLLAVAGILAVLIYLHVSGKKQDYFRKPAEA